MEWLFCIFCLSKTKLGIYTNDEWANFYVYACNSIWNWYWYGKRVGTKTDQIIKSFPEVQTVFAKVGRAISATDPAPLAMIETIVTFKPESQWREGMTYKKINGRDEWKTSNKWTYKLLDISNKRKELICF